MSIDDFLKIARESVDNILIVLGFILVLFTKETFYGIPAFVFGIFSTVAGLILKWLKHKKSKSLNIIAWWGFEEKDIRMGFGPYPMHFLGYLRCIDKVSELRLDKLPFDILIVDIEYLDRFRDSLVPLDQRNFQVEEVNRLWRDIIPDIASQALVKWGQGVENPHAFKHEMNRTPWESTEMFQETSYRSSKHGSHNLQQPGIFHTNPKPQ